MTSKVKFKPVSYSEARYMDHGTKLADEAGKMLCEAIHAKAQSGNNKWASKAVRLAEKAGIRFKEDVTLSTASGAFTTMLSTTLYSAAVENIKNILELVYINDDLKDKGGFGAYKIPRLQPTVAVEVAEGAVVSYFDEGVDSITVVPRKVVVGTKISWELMKRGMDSFIKFVLQNAADSISRKLSGDILNGLSAGAAFSTGGGVTYDKIIDSQAAVEDAKYGNGTPYGFLCTHLVLAPTSWATLAKSTDWKNHVYYTTARPGDLTLNPTVLKFNQMDIVVSPFLTAAEALVMDSKKAAMLIRESELETFEGALPGDPYDREIVALLSYVLAIIYPTAIAKIVA